VKEAGDIMRAFVVGYFLVMAASTGCATMGNSPAQELAWERWQACDRFSTISLERIEMDGRLIVTGQALEAAPFTACVRESAAAQVRQGVVAAAPASLVLVKIFGCQGGPT
jgi:hypothetical protein